MFDALASLLATAGVAVSPASNNNTPPPIEFNCSSNITAIQEPGPLLSNVLVTAVFAVVSWISALLYVIQNICGRIHNQWPHSQIQWLAYSILALDTTILVGALWGFRASSMPSGFCQAQGMVVQFISTTIFGWFMVITLTMRQMITKQNSVHELADRFRVMSLVLVFVFATVLTGVPAAMQYIGGYHIFGPSPYNTWCWITVCESPYYQIVFLEAETLLAVVAGSSIALVAMCKLWDIRKYSSQSFQPRIRIYMYRRLTFIAAYAAEILLLVLTWLVFHFSHEQSTASFVVDKAVICGSGILLLMAFGVPDRCCMCQCRKMSEMQSISNAKATAALLVQAEREASERERQARRDRLELGSSDDDWGRQ